MKKELMVIKMRSGEQIIAEVSDRANADSEFKYSKMLHNPAAVMIAPMPNGQLGTTLIDWLMSDVVEFPINERDYVTMAVPSKSLKQAWENKVAQKIKERSGIEVING